MAKKYDPTQPTYVKANVYFSVQNRPETIKVLAEQGSVGRFDPVQLHELMFGLAMYAADFWARSIGGTPEELNQQMDLFREKLARTPRYYGAAAGSRSAGR